MHACMQVVVELISQCKEIVHTSSCVRGFLSFSCKCFLETSCQTTSTVSFHPRHADIFVDNVHYFEILSLCGL